MYVKILALIGFAAVALAADLTVGAKGGTLIFKENVTASPAIWRQAKNLTVNATENHGVISRIVVIDNRPEKDGEAKVVEGGEGHKNVTIELQSPAVFRGFDFSIQVFAVHKNGAAPENPKTIGLDTKIPHVTYSKDTNVNDKQVPIKSGEENSRNNPGASKPTAASTTQVTITEVKDKQDKVSNPAIVSKDQTRPNRDTKDQDKEQSTIHTPAVPVSKNDKKTDQEPELDEDFRKAIDAIFAENSMQKTEDTSKSAKAFKPFKIDLVTSDDDENRKIHESTKATVIPDLPKELKGDDFHTSTPKIDHSTTEKKIIEKDEFVPKVLPISTENSSTTEKGKIVTKSSKLPEDVKTTQDLERNLKGHHVDHHHALPLPYINN